MLHELERNIGFYRIRIESVPVEKDRISLLEAMEQLEPLYENSDAYWIHKAGSQSVRLLDFDNSHPEYYIFLVSLTKTEIADPSFEHIQTGDSRTERKQDGEGMSCSAHMLIYKNESREHGGISHRVAIERVPGLGSSIVGPFLNHIYKKAYELNPRVFAHNHTGRYYRPRVNLTGDLSTSLLREIQRGHIAGIDLIDHRDVQSDLDEEGVLRETKAVLQLKVVGNPDERTLNRVINNIRRRARGINADEVKIRIKRDDTGEQTIPINIDLDRDATETLAIRKEMVTVADPLGQRHDAIRYDLVNLIHAIEDMI